MRIVAALALLLACLGCARNVAVPPQSRGLLLEQLSWVEAERALTPHTVVVLALGAESKEHGPHLKLGNDFLMAEYLKRRVLSESEVVVAPTINFGFYPAFTSYPGSTSLRFETAENLIVDVVSSLARYGPRRFYIINTGVSTLGTLEAAASALASKGLLLRYTNLLHANETVERQVRQEEGGTHAGSRPSLPRFARRFTPKSAPADIA